MDEPTDAKVLAFRQRLAIGEELEVRVAHELTARGWTVIRHGQGVWPEEIRSALKAQDSDYRYAPDLLAARGNNFVMIDCKNVMRARDGDCHNISRKSLAAMRKLAALGDEAVYYVFDSLGVMTPEEVLSWQRLRRVGDAGSHIMIPRHLPAPFDDVFGFQGTGRPLLRAA